MHLPALSFDQTLRDTVVVLGINSVPKISQNTIGWVKEPSLVSNDFVMGSAPDSLDWMDYPAKKERKLTRQATLSRSWMRQSLTAKFRYSNRIINDLKERGGRNFDSRFQPWGFSPKDARYLGDKLSTAWRTAWWTSCSLNGATSSMEFSEGFCF